MRVIRCFCFLFLLVGAIAFGSGGNGLVPLYQTEFSRLPPGNFGEFAIRGFPEYHHIPRKFTDGWNIVNNHGPEEWKVFEVRGRHVLDYLAYNAATWTKDFTYPIIVTGDALWTDYTVEARVTPLSRADVADLRGLIFRYQNGRQYYFFGFGPKQTLVLRYRDGEKGFQQDGWHEIATKQLTVDPAREYSLQAEAYGSKITCRLDGDTIFSVTDSRYGGGKIGLLACSPIRFHGVRVETTAAEEVAYLARKTKQADGLHALRASNPRPVLWKKISTPGFGTARAIRLGDLNGDGRTDMLLVQNIPFFGANYHQISCLTAIDLDGNVLWQRGKPDPDHAYLSYDVAVQIYDIDDDGALEVIYAQDKWIRILEGKTGHLKAEYPVPASQIQPEEASWKEFQHYYRRDQLPYLNVDCISFADLRGLGKPLDIIIKDRHTRLWAYTNKFELLWTGTATLSHFPYFYDSDHDGKDEVFIGYTLFDHDGTKVWTLDNELRDHADGICSGDFCLDKSGDRVFISASDDGVVVASPQGKILLHHRIGHAQTPSVGQYRPDIPGLEFCEINFWGEPGLISLYNGCTGEEITRFELIHEGSPIMPVNWRGDGQEFILLSTNSQEGGMVDGWGRRVVMFPDDGHPDMAYLVHDLTGDPRDEIITWNPDAIYIYTQSTRFSGDRIYAPHRPPTYNESNYVPIVSWPDWKGAAR
jgi:rhamnogalacturonan endolyase